MTWAHSHAWQLAVDHLRNDGLGWNHWTDLALFPESHLQQFRLDFMRKAKEQGRKWKYFKHFGKFNIPSAKQVT